jgi:uncharacterized membrane protein YbaN (DUF454 family)
VKLLYAILGLISLFLGILGIFLPFLPTTPFLLLSAALFAKSSTRLYNWVINHKIFGKYIQSYRDEKSIPLRIKFVALAMMWGTMLFTIFTIAVDKWWLQFLLLSIALGVTLHILSLKTKKEC